MRYRFNEIRVHRTRTRGGKRRSSTIGIKNASMNERRSPVARFANFESVLQLAALLISGGWLAMRTLIQWRTFRRRHELCRCSVLHLQVRLGLMTCNENAHSVEDVSTQVRSAEAGDEVHHCKVLEMSRLPKE